MTWDIELNTALRWLAKPDVTDWMLLVLTFFIYRLNKRLTWFTGAMERHSDQNRRMNAIAGKIPVIYWDNTIHPWPDCGQHGERDYVSYITVGVAPGGRKYRGFRRLLKWLDKFLGKYPPPPVLPNVKSEIPRKTRPSRKQRGKS